MVCLGLAPGATGWKVQTHPLTQSQSLRSHKFLPVLKYSSQVFVELNLWPSHRQIKKFVLPISSSFWAWFSGLKAQWTTQDRRFEAWTVDMCVEAQFWAHFSALKQRVEKVSWRDGNVNKQLSQKAFDSLENLLFGPIELELPMWHA